MRPDRLVVMVNQIGRFFAVQGAHGSDEKAVAAIAEHLRKFWDPRMRAEILTLPEEAAANLDPLPRRAVRRLGGADG